MSVAMESMLAPTMKMNTKAHGHGSTLLRGRPPPWPAHAASRHLPPTI